MIRSMTSYAKAQLSAREGGWFAELHSWNHRYFEFSLRVPPWMNALEHRLRSLVQSKMTRGKIMISITQMATREQDSGLRKIDAKAIRHYRSQFSRLQKEFKLSGELGLSDLLTLPGIFDTNQDKVIDPEKNWPKVKKLMEQLLENAAKSQQIEGGKLAEDMRSRLDKIGQVTFKIEEYTRDKVTQVYEKLKKRMEELFQEIGKDPDRLHREAAFLAERSDITEEMVRLRSHLDLFKKRLKEGGSIGRELDFLCQEMHREVNTLSSKSQIFEISRDAVFLKGEIEKIREQVQNIE